MLEHALHWLFVATVGATVLIWSAIAVVLVHDIVLMVEGGE